jgi:hypothetical protein
MDAAANILHDAAYRIAENRSKKSTEACQKYFAHANDSLPDLVGVISPAGGYGGLHRLCS